MFSGSDGVAVGCPNSAPQRLPPSSSKVLSLPPKRTRPEVPPLPPKGAGPFFCPPRLMLAPIESSLRGDAGAFRPSARTKLFACSRTRPNPPQTGQPHPLEGRLCVRSDQFTVAAGTSPGVVRSTAREAFTGACRARRRSANELHSCSLSSRHAEKSELFCERCSQCDETALAFPLWFSGSTDRCGCRVLGGPSTRLVSDRARRAAGEAARRANGKEQRRATCPAGRRCGGPRDPGGCRPRTR